ncbi:retrovirus-related pol polyprotein [Plakobranchus ocellatus]|uniref:Retrovirus-related pol polyprotein n=1 Tax=Plakobranchus ocellatus TaxID=259542 RepID=A0AAV4AQ03_9GAST|nr:retrovirus-related pol polyprotein [Plakobranchus ocellatus]
MASKFLVYIAVVCVSCIAFCIVDSCLSISKRKRQSQGKIEGAAGLINAPAICAVNSSSISVTDIISGRSFLVDTGAEESVFPATNTDKKKSRGPNLIAANGSAIATYGKRPISLKLSKTTLFKQTFWIADVTQPILGADFFTSHRLAIDLNNKRLVSLDGGLIVNARPTHSPRPGIHKVHSKYEAILEDFPELLTPTFQENKHGVVHHIPTSGPAVHARARRLDNDKLSAAKAEFEELERLGIIRRSTYGKKEQWRLAPVW